MPSYIVGLGFKLFGLRIALLPYFVYTSSKGSGKTEDWQACLNLGCSSIQ